MVGGGLTSSHLPHCTRASSSWKAASRASVRLWLARQPRAAHNSVALAAVAGSAGAPPAVLAFASAAAGPCAKGSSMVLAVVRIPSITLLEEDSTIPDSRKPERSAAESSLFADSRLRHCTCRMGASSLKVISAPSRAPRFASTPPSTAPGSAAGSVCADAPSSAAHSSSAVTVLCSTSSQRPAVRPWAGDSKSTTRPEHEESATRVELPSASRTSGAIGASSEPLGDLSASASLESAFRLFASKWACLGRVVGSIGPDGIRPEERIHRLAHGAHKTTEERCSLRPSPIGTLRGEGVRVAPEGTSPQGLLTQKRWGGGGGGGERGEGEDRLVV
eukprot:scaffold5231_cov119-Isochrysis_galbana.AAC.9